MSLINDMLNDLEQNKDNNNPKKEKPEATETHKATDNKKSATEAVHLTQDKKEDNIPSEPDTKDQETNPTPEDPANMIHSNQEKGANSNEAQTDNDDFSDLDTKNPKKISIPEELSETPLTPSKETYVAKDDVVLTADKHESSEPDANTHTEQTDESKSKPTMDETKPKPPAMPPADKDEGTDVSEAAKINTETFSDLDTQNKEKVSIPEDEPQTTHPKACESDQDDTHKTDDVKVELSEDKNNSKANASIPSDLDTNRTEKITIPEDGINIPSDNNQNLTDQTNNGVTLTQDNNKSQTTHRQPWESDQDKTKQTEDTADLENNEIEINTDSSIIKENKPSQKRLIIWIVIIGIACLVLAFLYFWPNEKKAPSQIHTPIAVPSTPAPKPIADTPQVDIQKDTTKNSPTNEIDSTPSDKQLPTSTDTAAKPIKVVPVIITPHMQAQNAYDDIMSQMNSLSSFQAINKLKAVVDEHPKFKAARTTLAAMLVKYGNASQALQILEVGLAQNASDKNMAELTAHILVEQNNIADALRILKKAQPATIQADPNYYALMAGLYLQEKDFAQAQNFYQALTNLNPQNGTWWAGLAISSEKLGQPQAARSAYNQAETVGGLTPALQAYINETMEGS